MLLRLKNIFAVTIIWEFIISSTFSQVSVPDNGAVLDTLENVGFRLRGNTSRGADKKSFKKSFKISFNDILNIFLEEKNQNSWRIQLTDLTGRVLLEKNDLTGQFLGIDLQKEKLSKGIYFLTLKMEDKGKMVRKIVFTE